MAGTAADSERPPVRDTDSVSRGRGLGPGRSAAARATWTRATELLASGLGPRAASQALAAECGLGRTQANRYVGAALKQLQSDDAETLESKRIRVLARYEDLYQRALNRTRALILGDDIVQTPDPDLKAAGTFLGAIAIIHGLVQPQPGLRDPGGRSPPAQLPAGTLPEAIVIPQTEALEQARALRLADRKHEG